MKRNRKFPARKPRRPKMKLGLPDLDQFKVSGAQQPAFARVATRLPTFA
jgi:hypothetical protein